MAGKYDSAFPNAKKVQIFKQVDIYIENNQQESSESALLAIVQIIQTLERKWQKNSPQSRRTLHREKPLG
jgi:hypothetical protein